MKLTDLHENEAKPVFAWLEPASGPEGVKGLRLAYLQPLVPELDAIIAHAEEQAERGNARERERAERVRRDKEAYVAKGQRAFTPDMGWWMNKEDFEAGKAGFGGVTKTLVQKKYPNLRIVSSRKEAFDLAEEAGLI